MSIKIKDISEHLGLSVSTVSKALNGYADVSATTRDRVQETARLLGYQPSAVARNLRRGRTDKIGFVFNNSLTYITDYFSEIIVGATGAAEQHGNNIILYTSHGDSLDGLKKLVQAREVDGFILVWNHVPAATVEIMKAAQMPFVVLGRRVEHPDASYIAPDNYNGGLALMRHFVELGHRRIGFMTRPSMGLTNTDRFNAYKAGLAEAGINFDPALVIETKIELLSGYHAMNQLLDLSEPPTAVFAFHDFVAIDAQRAILDRGLRIPEDVALAGFDGLRRSLFTTPPITTVSQPLVEIGRESVFALLQRINDSTLLPIQRTMPVKLEKRQSTVGRQISESMAPMMP